jgi:hypothetical protein
MRERPCPRQLPPGFRHSASEDARKRAYGSIRATALSEALTLRCRPRESGTHNHRTLLFSSAVLQR